MAEPAERASQLMIKLDDVAIGGVERGGGLVDQHDR